MNWPAQKLFGFISHLLECFETSYLPTALRAHFLLCRLGPMPTAYFIILVGMSARLPEDLVKSHLFITSWDLLASLTVLTIVADCHLTRDENLRASRTVLFILFTPFLHLFLQSGPLVCLSGLCRHQLGLNHPPLSWAAGGAQLLSVQSVLHTAATYSLTVQIM